MSSLPPGSGGSSRSARILAVSAFLGATLVALVLLLVVGPGSSPSGISFEIAKACIQVIGVAVVGGVVSLAAFAFQRDRIERYEALQRTRIESHEDLRREADRLLEDRRRDDEFLREVIDEVIEGYNEVKKVRRTVTAEFYHRSGRVSGETYLRAVATLTDQQLIFESLHRRAPQMNGVDLHDRTNARGEDEDHFRVVERYLNRILHEYQETPWHTGDDAEIDVDRRYPRFRQFVIDTPRFRDRASEPVRSAVAVLQERLRRPVYLPGADASRQG